jgi:hypothetical protein
MVVGEILMYSIIGILARHPALKDFRIGPIQT